MYKSGEKKMRYAKDWKDYEIIATGNGEKLERWGDIKLLRPDPQIIWDAKYDLSKEKGLNGHYHRENTGGGKWKTLIPTKDEWTISYKDLKFLIKPMGFKHTGLFPEQAVNWDIMIDLIQKANRPIKVLNLFAYTGGATVACTYAGAEVTHVDASKGIIECAKKNMELSGLKDKPVRYMVDDCKKFVEREIRRGKKYDAIIMDPPSYGKGPSGETWRINENLYDFIKLTAKVLSDTPLFVLVNTYASGLQPTIIGNLLELGYPKGKVENYEIGIPTKEGIILPCGSSSIKIWK